MKSRRFPLHFLWLLLVSQLALAQNAFNNATNLPGSSDNTGQIAYQLGTEVVNSTPGMGVTFESGGSFEHIGQFYVAKNGIWNPNVNSNSTTAGTDYFGYAPDGVGANLPYLGTGIRGASLNNGGKGIGRPLFGHLQLNSTGLFPVEGGMYIAHSLRFNANGPGKSNVILTPNSNSPNFPTDAIVFSPTAIVAGADQSNYINGYASVTGVINSFSLPLGDADGFPNSLRSVTINNPTPGTVTARYQHTNLHPNDARGAGIGSISSLGSWPVSAPEGTNLTVSLPALDLNPNEATTLRLVGWTGSQWVDLSGAPTTGACTTGNCPLTGVIRTGVIELGIGSTSRVFTGKENAETVSLSVWPNPTQGKLNVKVSSGLSISQVQVVDLQGRSVLQPLKGVANVDASALTSGQYLVEVLTNQGQTLRKSFVKIP